MGPLQTRLVTPLFLFFFQTASRHPLLGDFLGFGRHFGAPGLQKGCQNGLQSRGKMAPFLIDSHKVAKVGPERGQDPQNDPKMVPQGAKMEPQGPQIEDLGLKTVAQKWREFRPFRERNEPYHKRYFFWSSGPLVSWVGCWLLGFWASCFLGSARWRGCPKGSWINYADVPKH